MSSLNMISRAIESSFSWQTKASDSIKGKSSFYMICLFRVDGAGILRHARDIRKIYEGQSFDKDKGKWWGNYQFNDAVVFNDCKGSINCLNA